MTSKSVLILDPGNFTPYYDTNLSRALSEHDWQVEWLTSPYLFETVPIPEGLHVRNIFFGLVNQSIIQRLLALISSPLPRRLLKALSYPFDLFRLDRELSVRAPGIVHVQWALLPWLDAIIYKRWKTKGWKIVYTAHDVAPLAGTTPRILGASHHRIFRIADCIFCHSAIERERVIATGVPRERTAQIPQGSPGIFECELPEKSQARTSLAINPDRPVILFHGLLKPYKGLDVLLRSLVRVRVILPRVLLIIAGYDMGVSSNLRRLVAALHIADHVVWSTRYVPSRDVSVYFAASDVVALPYLSGSSSAVLVTAYTYGKPVVATNVGGLSEMIEEGETGYVVPAGDFTALADALIQILRNPERSAAMGDRAHELAQTRHSWRLIANQTNEIYQRLLKSCDDTDGTTIELVAHDPTARR